MPVQDVDRPDVNGTTPKMQAIKQAADNALNGILPHLLIHTDDNIMSSVSLWATKEPKEQWPNGIFHNAHYVIASITPAKDQRYYNPNTDPLVTVKVSSTGSDVPKFRKYTGTPDKAINKLKDYLQTLANQD